jgi:hypothetical protein
MQVLEELPPVRNHIDIQQLFEDREFEDQLLDFLTQRMDPQRPRSIIQSEPDPPSYHGQGEDSDV